MPRVRVLHGRKVFADGTVYVAGQALDVRADRAGRLIATGHVEAVATRKKATARKAKKPPNK